MCKNGGTDDRHIEWYAKTAESMIDLLNGADMVCKNGRTDVIPIE